MKIDWVDGFKISVQSTEDEVTISANKEGLLSLSKQLTEQATEETGSHYHLDEHSALEEGSSNIVIEKI